MHARIRSVMGQMARAGAIRTDVPARMDRLPWSRWHRLVVAALGITWAFNGLGVAVVAAIGPVLTEQQTLNLSILQVGYAATIYLFGTILGALILGYEADGFGRKRLILIGVGVYAAGTFATAFSSTYWSFALFRFVTGFGVGGQYAAINSLINELVPARSRGRANLAVNGSYWAGAIIGIGSTIALLNPGVLPPSLGWRVSFAVAAVLAFGVVLVQRYVPESPRWLMIRRGPALASVVVGRLEQRIRREEELRELPRPVGVLALRPESRLEPSFIVAILFRMYPRRTMLGFVLMAGQAFLYNSIFFTYALVLSSFYGVAFYDVGIYLVGLGVGSLLGPWLLGRLFDGVGRRSMIAATYVTSGVLLGITGYLFSIGILNPVTQTIAWATILFFASAGASAAYLSLGELFPLEFRATILGLVYAAGTAVGGLVGPALFAGLIETGSSTQLFYGGYLVGAILMVVAGLAELPLGEDAERRPLESVARPILAEAVREQPVAPRRKKPKRKAA